MPVSDTLDRIAAPVGLLAVFGALAVLLVAAWAGDLDRALSRIVPPSEERPLPVPVRSALHALAAVPAGRPPQQVRMADVVARRALGPYRGPDADLRRCAYRYLLLTGGRRDRLPAWFSASAAYPLPDGGQALGLREAARAAFGLSADSLSTGEALLLLHQALAPEPARPLDGDAAIEVRNRLLREALDRGVIDRPRYDAEVRKPLSRAEDPRPIW